MSTTSPAEQPSQSFNFDLPVEILDEFCRYLSRDDLKNFALSCKKFLPSAYRLLFRTVFLKINLDSFDHLRCISEDEIISKYVKELEYDSRIIPTHATTFEGWMMDCAGHGVCLCDDDRKRLLALVPTSELQKFYRAHCQYVYGQNYLRNGSNIKHLLRSALSKLPHISSLSYSSKLHHDWYLPETYQSFSTWKDLSGGAVAKQIFQEPVGKMASRGRDGDASDPEFQPFWEMCSEAINPQNILELHLRDLDLRLCQRDANRYVEILGDKMKLDTLFLSFCTAFVADVSEGGFDLTRGLDSQNSLRTLGLNFDPYPFYEYDRFLRLDRVISPGKHWKNLRRLSLAGLSASYQELTSLLKRHASTLRHLELAEMKIINTSSDQPKYWIDLLNFLNQQMMLTWFNMMGCWDSTLTVRTGR